LGHNVREPLGLAARLAAPIELSSRNPGFQCGEHTQRHLQLSATRFNKTLKTIKPAPIVIALPIP
jgi:hypothetical protein